MALYSIIRVYEVPAETKQQATERMLEALMFHVEKDFHVKDIIREPNEKPGQGKAIDLRPTGWLTLMDHGKDSQNKHTDLCIHAAFTNL